MYTRTYVCIHLSRRPSQGVAPESERERARARVREREREPEPEREIGSERASDWVSERARERERERKSERERPSEKGRARPPKLITVLECESTRPHALLSDLPYRCLHRHTPENTLALCLQHTCLPAYIHRTYMQHACMHTYIHACRHTYAHQITNPCATSTASVSLFWDSALKINRSSERTVGPSHESEWSGRGCA